MKMFLITILVFAILLGANVGLLIMSTGLEPFNLEDIIIIKEENYIPIPSEEPFEEPFTWVLSKETGDWIKEYIPLLPKPKIEVFWEFENWRIISFLHLGLREGDKNWTGDSSPFTIYVTLEDKWKK